MSMESNSTILSAVDEIEDNLYYFSDVVSAGIPDVGRLIMDNILKLLIVPLVLPSLRIVTNNVCILIYLLSFIFLAMLLFSFVIFRHLICVFLVTLSIMILHLASVTTWSVLLLGIKTWCCHFFIFTLLHSAHCQNQRSGKHYCRCSTVFSSDLHWDFGIQTQW